MVTIFSLLFPVGPRVQQKRDEQADCHHLLRWCDAWSPIVWIPQWQVRRSRICVNHEWLRSFLYKGCRCKMSLSVMKTHHWKHLHHKALSFCVCFSLLQVWQTTAAPGVLFGIHLVCGLERVLHLIHDVCHHEVLHGAVAGRDQYYLHRLKWVCNNVALSWWQKEKTVTHFHSFQTWSGSVLNAEPCAGSSPPWM